MCNKLELNLNVCFNYGADGGEKLASHIPKQPLKVENHWISLEICQSIVVMHTQTSEWLLCLLLHCSVVGNKILITIDYFLFLVIITNKLSKEGVVLPQKKKLCTYFFLRNKIITLHVQVIIIIIITSTLTDSTVYSMVYKPQLLPEGNWCCLYTSEIYFRYPCVTNKRLGFITVFGWSISRYKTCFCTLDIGATFAKWKFVVSRLTGKFCWSVVEINELLFYSRDWLGRQDQRALRVTKAER